MLPVTFPLAFFKPIVPSFTSFLPCEDRSDFYRKKERITVSSFNIIKICKNLGSILFASTWISKHRWTLNLESEIKRAQWTMHPVWPWTYCPCRVWWPWGRIPRKFPVASECAPVRELGHLYSVKSPYWAVVNDWYSAALPSLKNRHFTRISRQLQYTLYKNPTFH